MSKIIQGLGSLSIFILLAGCVTSKPDLLITTDFPDKYPKVEREFRAAWVATVANINWPSEPGLSVEKQKQEAVKLLNLLQKNNFNAVIFQVRPQCDALYKSELEPWSYYLTGKQGKAPDPFYDPLEYWIEEAHNRGLELHVWLNPYRAHHVSGGPISDSSIVKKCPDLVVKLETGYWWMDPGNPGTQDHSIAVVKDIIQRYDIDGVHMDDYFYPYPSYNNNNDFPDDASWAVYQNNGGNLSREDWRRENVNTLIKRLYTAIKEIKPYVKFGLSPFGIWRPYHPKSIRGFDQYNELYADAKLWLNKGWIDYWTPQLYWPVNQIQQSYPVLLGWWLEQNIKRRHLWPGISIGRKKGEEGADETINQIMITRGMSPDSPGNVHWSIAPLITNGDLREGLRKGPYKKAALIPVSPWLDNTRPAPPQVVHHIQQDNLVLSWRHVNPGDVFRWVVYYKYANTWQYKILSKKERSITLPYFSGRDTSPPYTMAKESLNIRGSLDPLSAVAISAVDRVGNESNRTTVDLSNESTSIIVENTILIPEQVLEKPAGLSQDQNPPENLEDFNRQIYYLIRCDDMGMNHSVNMAIKKVIASGLPISVSVMFACPWYQEAVDILKENPEIGVGIHLTLNAEWKNYRWGPVLGKKAVPSLVDREGYFYPSRSRLFENNPKTREIEKELRAQIERALESGIRIDYLDYHMGAAVQTKELREMVEGLAREYGLGMSGYFGEIYSNITYGAAIGDKTDSLIQHIENLGPGINMQVMHIGYDTPEMQALSDLNDFGLKNMSANRREELRSLLDPSVSILLKEKGITTITYKELIKIAGLESMKRPAENDY
jgi:uncharacterized lipoprotein YddW (UPF0748 family)/predicted glycoside hydrolase/deacetylase ChbG (UPF0249 family)